MHSCYSPLGLSIHFNANKAGQDQCLLLLPLDTAFAQTQCSFFFGGGGGRLDYELKKKKIEMKKLTNSRPRVLHIVPVGLASR